VQGELHHPACTPTNLLHEHQLVPDIKGLIARCDGHTVLPTGRVSGHTHRHTISRADKGLTSETTATHTRVRGRRVP
jgi:hypothetical protein